MTEEIELHRLEDDGAPPPRIGVRMPVGFTGQVVDPPAVAAGQVGPDPTPEPKPVSWAEYMAWRKTKCPPFDRYPDFSGKEEGGTLHHLNNATLEMIGEVGELTMLWMKTSGLTMFYGDNREKLLDEAGDIVFTATWAGEAWLHELAVGLDEAGPELALMSPQDIVYREISEVLRLARDPHEIPDILQGAAMNVVEQAILTANAAAGLVANAAKKVMYRYRAQDCEAQAGRCLTIVVCVRDLLTLAGFTLQDAIRANMEKLDRLRPDGWVEGDGPWTGNDQ